MSAQRDESNHAASASLVSDPASSPASASAAVLEALRTGSESFGFTIDDAQTAEIRAVATDTLQAVRAEGPKHLTESAANGIENLLRSQLDTATAGEINENMRQVADKIAPALTGMGMDETKSRLLSQMMTTVSEKLVRSMQHQGGDGGETATAGGHGDGDGGGGGGGGEGDDCPEYLAGVVNEYCARVHMLLYKLALYARPLDELKAYEGETDENKRKFESVVHDLMHGSGDSARRASAALYNDEVFQAAYMERIRHMREEDREGAEDQLVLWFENVVNADSLKFKRETMQNWHDACKNHYAFLNSRVSHDSADKAVREAVPEIYPLHAARLLEFWDEEAFADSRNEVLVDLEQINMLSAVSSGLPEPMQRIMGKLTQTAAYDKLAATDGNIDQAALMQAAIETVSSLSAKDTLDLMNSIPELLRSFSGPMSSALQSVGGMDGAAKVLSDSGVGSLLSSVALDAGNGGAGAGAGANAEALSIASSLLQFTAGASAGQGPPRPSGSDHEGDTFA